MLLPQLGPWPHCPACHRGTIDRAAVIDPVLGQPLQLQLGPLSLSLPSSTVRSVGGHTLAPRGHLDLTSEPWPCSATTFIPKCAHFSRHFISNTFPDDLTYLGFCVVCPTISPVSVLPATTPRLLPTSVMPLFCLWLFLFLYIPFYTFFVYRSRLTLLREMIAVTQFTVLSSTQHWVFSIFPVSVYHFLSF